MSLDDFNALVPLIAYTGVTWILGCWWGLHLAWTQESRMRRWATYYARQFEQRKGIE
jgi:hypothetical protein